MHSFLIIGANTTQVLRKAEEISDNFAIHTFDKTILESETAIGIQDIRNIQKNILFSPLKGTKKALIVKNAHTMTIDAQNAFLKTLEEPPHDTIILLLAQTKQSFLPTVISRCSIISLPEEHETVKEKDISILDMLESLSLSQKLYHAQAIAKSKEVALEWFMYATKKFQKLLHEKPTRNIVSILIELSKTYKILKQTNANTRTVVEHFFLTAK